MSVEVKLLAIKFNHDTKSATNDALNIRRNASQPVIVPEWRQGMSSPKESVAAYAIKETSNNVLTIQAQFRTGEFFNQTIEVRAVEPFGPAPPLPWPLVLILLWIMLLLGLPVPFNILGRVAPTTVKFGPRGESDFVPFELHFPLWNIPFWKLRMVGIFDVKWQWQYRISGGSWKNFNTSVHRIYTVLEIPKGPWEQLPGSKQLPWTEALDIACKWASGTSTADMACKQITERLNGNPLLSYTPKERFGFGGSNKVYYGGAIYLLSSFLNRLRSNKSFNLNCTDCANAVTTLANLLGCDLWEGQILGLYTRKILAIGGDPAKHKHWRNKNWLYHEIAWLRAIGQNEYLYDASLQVDMDDDYKDKVHIPRLPVKMKFGKNDPNDYRYRLVESGSCTLKNLQRRPIA